MNLSYLATEDAPTEFSTSETAPLSGLRGALRKAFSFPVMLMAWLVLIVVRLAERNLPDIDLWWHLRNAQYLFHTTPFPSLIRTRSPWQAIPG